MYLQKVISKKHKRYGSADPDPYQISWTRNTGLFTNYLWSRPACSNDVELVRLLAHTLESLLTGQNQVDDS
jgi:hypothetical protein